MEAEFTDDTRLFLKGTNSNLQLAEMAIDNFCKASKAKINWSKTVGFWVGKEAPPIWSPDEISIGFQEERQLDTSTVK